MSFTLHGFDVSHHQGTQPPNFAANGRVFGVCKATEGVSMRDNTLDTNRNTMHNVGLEAIGMYHFARSAKNSAQKEADWFLTNVGARREREYAVLDYEEKGVWSEDWAIDWLTRVHNAGWPVLFYTYEAMIRPNPYQRIAKIAPFWIAKYSNKPPTVPWLFWQHCVDSDTEILTARGWLKHEDVATGDETLTINRETGFAEWQPIEKVSRFDYEGPMVALEGEQPSRLVPPGAKFSALVTPNHRWWLLADDSGKLELRLAEEFDGTERVPLAAVASDVPAAAKYDDDFVELVAWYWTEGSPTRHGEVLEGAYISQSHIRHPEYCARIRGALTRQFGPAVIRNRPRSATWVESIGMNGVTKFRLSMTAAAELHHVAPNRRVTVDFIRSLTRAQLRLFVETSIDADGWRSGASTSISQKDPAMLLGFEVACLMLGIGITKATRETPQSWIDRYGWEPSPTAVIQLLRRTSARPIRKPNENYAGIVWCPTTPNGTWLARRHGSVYFTGNTDGQPSIPGNDGPFDCSVFASNNIDDLRVFVRAQPQENDDMAAFTDRQVQILENLETRSAAQSDAITKIREELDAMKAQLGNSNTGNAGPHKWTLELKEA